MEKTIYLYDKEKDTTLEGYITELSTMTEEERVAFFEKLSVEERKELYSYMKWQAAAERSKRLYLEAKNRFLREQREQLLKEREENERKLNEITINSKARRVFYAIRTCPTQMYLFVMARKTR